MAKQEPTQASQIRRLTKQPPCSSTCPIIIIDDDDEEETLDSMNKKADNVVNLVSPTINSLGSLPSNDAITIIDKEETKEPKQETLEPNKKKPGLGSWWNYVESSNELSSVVKGLPNNDSVLRVDSCFSSTNIHEKKRKDNLSVVKIVRSGYRHVTLEELGVTVEDLKSMPWDRFDPIWEIRSETMDPWLGGYINDIISPDHYNSLP